MTDIEGIDSWIGADVIDPTDTRVGKLDDLVLDVDTGKPAYGIVKHGVLARRSIVPLGGARFNRGYLRVAVAADLVSSAPVDFDQRLTAADHALLLRHFGDGTDASTHEQGGDADAVRFESAKVVVERQRAAAADLRRAEQLEADAAEKHEQSGALHRDAQQRDERAAKEDAERDRLLAEAAEARAAAERGR
jgi:sporulation protein YlmC with PRC-barrel domain